MADGRVTIQVLLDDEGVSQGINDIENDVGGIEGAGKKSQLSLGKLAGALGLVAAGTAAFGMIKDGIQTAFARIDTMEQFERTMTAMTGSSEEAAAALDRTRESVTGTGYGLDVAAKSVQGFVTSGVDINKATDYMAAFGDAVAFYGEGSNEQLASVSRAMSQMAASGSTNLEEINSLVDAGIPVFQIYGEAVGISAAEARKALEGGKTDASEFMEVMSEALMNGTESFAGIEGAAKDAGASWGAAFDNMQAAVGRGVTAIIQKIDELLKSNGLPDMREMISQVGTAFEVTLTWIANTGIPLVVSAIENLVSFLKEWGDELLAVAAGATTLFAIMNAAKAWTAIVAGVTAVRTALVSLRATMLLVNAAVLANPFALIAAAAVAVVTLIILNWDSVKQFFITLWDGIKAGSQAAWDWIKEASSATALWLTETWNSLKEFFSTLWEGIKQLFIDNWNMIAEFLTSTWTLISETATTVWNGILEFFTTLWGNFKTGIETVWNAIVSFFTTTWTKISDDITTTWEAIKTFFVETWEAITTTLQEAWTAISTFFTETWDKLSAQINEVWDGLKTYFSETWDVIKTTLETAWNAILTFFTETWESISNKITETWEAIKGYLIETWESIQTSIIEIWTAIREWFENLWNGLKTFITTIWESIKTTITNVANNIWNTLKTAWNNVVKNTKSQFKSLYESIKERLEDTWDKVKDIAEDIKNVFKNLSLKQIGKDIINGLIDGIESTKEKLLQKGRDIINSLPEAIKKVLGIASPSKLFNKEIGQEMIAGLMVGMEVKQDDAVNDAEKIMNDIVAAFQGTPISELVGNAVNYARSAATNAKNTIGAGATQQINNNAPGIEVVLEYNGDGVDGLKDARTMVNAIDIELSKRTDVAAWLKGFRAQRGSY